jgi:predicted Zn-dependent protease
MTHTQSKPSPLASPARPWRRTLVAAVALGAAGFATWRLVVEVRASRDLTVARAALDRGDLLEARSRLARCLAAWPESAEAHFLAGRAARRDGDVAEAERLLMASKRLGWVPEAIDLEYALIRAQAGDLDAVEGYLQDCLARDHPDSVLILEVLSRAYLRAFQLYDALPCLDRWLEKQPNSVAALLLKGDTALRLHNRFASNDAFRKAAELAPDNDDVQLRYGNVLVTESQGKKAAVLFEHLLARQPTNRAVRLGLARSRIALGEEKEARQLLEALLAERPNDVEVLAEYGRLELEAGRPHEAEKWLRQAVKDPPYESDLLFNFVRCLELCDKSDEAKTWRDKRERADADLRRLGQVARAIAEQAPRDADLRWEAGMLMLRNGYDKEGLRWLQSALQLEPAHVKTKQTLAEYRSRKVEKPK